MLKILYSSPIAQNSPSGVDTTLGGFISSTPIPSAQQSIFATHNSKQSTEYRLIVVQNLYTVPINLKVWSEGDVQNKFSGSLCFVLPNQNAQGVNYFESIPTKYAKPLQEAFAVYDSVTNSDVYLNFPPSTYVGIWMKSEVASSVGTNAIDINTLVFSVDF